MGLDMYLHAKKYVEKIDWNKLRDLDLDMDSDEAITPLWNDIVETAGMKDIATAEILKYVSDKTHPAVFSKMVVDFAEMFAKDNPRFDANRFYSASNYKIPSFRS